jgi:hypothetical protein
MEVDNDAATWDDNTAVLPDGIEVVGTADEGVGGADPRRLSSSTGS